MVQTSGTCDFFRFRQLQQSHLSTLSAQKGKVFLVNQNLPEPTPTKDIKKLKKNSLGAFPANPSAFPKAKQELSLWFGRPTKNRQNHRRGCLLAAFEGVSEPSKCFLLRELSWFLFVEGSCGAVHMPSVKTPGEHPKTL